MARPRPKDTTPAKANRLRSLTEEYLGLAARLREGGGPSRVKRMHDKGQLSPRERVAALLDPGSPWLEVGLLVAHDRYEGQAPAAGVITGLGVVEGREVVVVANDATVKAGSWWPETITKILRAQEIAMRERIPIVYLVDSAGVNLPYQDGVFPGQYGAARIFYYNSLMRRYLRVPQVSAVMGSCIAGGAYLPALSDVIFMVENTSFMGLGGPNLVKGATGQTIDGETLGGAKTHTELSAVAHYRAPTDADCLARVREYIGRLPLPSGLQQARRAVLPPARDPADLYEVMPHDHRLSYDARQVLACLLDGGKLDEFQPDLAREMICGHGHVEGWPVAVIANSRGSSRAARENGRVSAVSSTRKVRRRPHSSSRPPTGNACPSCSSRTSAGSWWAPKRSTPGSSGRVPTSSRRWPPPPCPRSS